VGRLVEIEIPEAVLRQACGGDEAARVVIYTATAPAAFALIQRLIANRAMAEDLFQDTMMAVFQRLADFRGEAPFGAWLRQIAISKCLMFLRSPWHRARLQLESDGGAEFALSSLVTPAPVVEGLDVEKALASLSPTARAVVWLYEVEGYSHEEIARSFGRTVSFSKSQLARAHVRLREWFEWPMGPPGPSRGDRAVSEEIPCGDKQICTTIQSNGKA
jgi:DNA-directed RNA polymerase specialized sigma24 family protein